MTTVSSSSQAAIERQPVRLETIGAETTSQDWQEHFLSLLPSIRKHAEVRFRNFSPELREELIQETIARSLFDYVRLVERGKEHVAFAGPLARYAVAQVCEGRRVGSRLNVRDVSSEYCRRRNRVSMRSLDQRDADSDVCRHMLMQDRRSTPAEIAAARIDIGQWLKTLPTRTRQLAEWLASGESTSSAASRLGVSRGRISQLRRSLEESWAAFQGEGVAALA